MHDEIVRRPFGSKFVVNFLLLDREPPESSMAEMKQVLRAKKEMLRSAAKSYDSAKTLFNKFSESDENRTNRSHREIRFESAHVWTNMGEYTDRGPNKLD